MMKSIFLALFTVATLTSEAHAVSRRSENHSDSAQLVTTCSNSEATYEFYGNNLSQIEYVIVKEKYFPNFRFECSNSQGTVLCKDPLIYDELTLEGGRFAVMHYSTNSDIKNDGEKAPCTAN